MNFITDFGYNGRHSYFYVALDKGYYKAEGLDVNILRGQGSADAIKKVASGAAVLGFADAGALVLARSNDAIPVKLLSIVYAGPPHAIFALADSGIKTAKDLEGRTMADLAFSAMPLIFNAFAQAAKIDREKVKWIAAESSALPSLLATGRVDAVGQFTVGEPLLAATVAPKTLVRIAYKDAGLDYYGNGIVATEKTIAENPAMLKAFVRATQKGMAGRLCQSEGSRRDPEQVSKADFAGGCGRRNQAGRRARDRSRPQDGRHRPGPHSADDRHHGQVLSDEVARATAGYVRPGLCGMTPGDLSVRQASPTAQDHKSGTRPAIELLGVTKVFGSGPEAVHALGPLDLTIETGSFVSVVGPSGCGKSTLLRLIAGLDSLSEGEMRRYGVDLDGPSRDVGIVFQDHVLFPWASILDNVMLPADVLSLPRAAARKRRFGCWT